MIAWRPERLSGSRPTRVIAGMRPRERYLSRYSRPVRRTLRPWKKRLLDRRLLPRRLARRLLARRLLPRAVVLFFVERFFDAAARRLPPRLLARVLAAFFAAAERFDAFLLRVAAAFFAAVERFEDFGFDVLGFDVFRFLVFVPDEAIVMPPALADSAGREERRRRGLAPPESIERAAARIDCMSELPL